MNLEFVNKISSHYDLQKIRQSLTLISIFRYVLAILWAAIWLIPLAAMIYIAMKTSKQLITNPFWSFPESIRLINNLALAWSDARFESYAFNSLIYATFGAGSAMVLSSFVAYAITQLNVHRSDELFYAILAIIFFPFQMYLIGISKTWHATGLFNTKIGMIIFYSAIAVPFAVLIMRNYFTTLPRSLFEAARIDGLTKYQIYWHIYAPLAKPAFAVVFIFQWVWIWNEFLFGLVLTSSLQTRPMATGLASLSGRSPDWSLLAAGTAISIIPPILIYIAFQKYFVRGLLSGANKG